MISVSDNIREVLSTTDRLSAQYPFAVAKALSDVARLVAQAMPAEASKDLEEPTPFTLRGFFSTRADKVNLTATVGVKDAQAEYLKYQVEGGSRAPKNKALRLPSKLDLDSYGNLPKGTIKRLVAAARSGRKVGGKTAKKLGIAQRSSVFYGTPKGGGRPAGLYSRRNDQGQRSLVPLVMFPQQPAKYEKRFDFYMKAERIVRAQFQATLRRSWERAQQSARR